MHSGLRIISPGIWTGLWIATLAVFAASLGALFVFAPLDESAGPSQKIIYIHLPVALNMIPTICVMFVASIGYLWQQRLVWDDLAMAAGKVTVLLCTVALVSGVFLSKAVWGQWWVWSPRLIFTLALWGVYAFYLLLRVLIKSPERRATMCAVYGLAAFLDVPLVYLFVNLMPDIHPAQLTLGPTMRTTLALTLIPVTLLTAGLVAAKFQINRRLRALAEDPPTPGVVMTRSPLSGGC